MRNTFVVAILYVLPLSIFSTQAFGRNQVDTVFKVENFAKHQSQLKAVPTFQSCGLYMDLDKQPEKTEVKFRKKGQSIWLPAMPAIYSSQDKQLRGTLFHLNENTNYDVAIIVTENGKSRVARTVFRTRNSNPKIAKVIHVKNLLTEKCALTISEHGTPNGWIKYVGDKNFTLNNHNRDEAAISIINSKYIILENIRIRNSMIHGIMIKDSEYINIVNCDVAGWGRPGKKRYDLDGKYYIKNKRNNKLYSLNHDSGIAIFNCAKILIERCFLHDPRSKSNSWFDSHPAGPNAIYLGHKIFGGIVIRYNDLIANDKRRWNDCIESWGNGMKDGGINRDGAVYGNMMDFGNDDGIEVEGGSMNIRTYQNRFENFLCGIGTGRTYHGPNYIFQNLIVNLGDERGKASQGFKNSMGRKGTGKVLHINNTSVGTIVGIGGFNSVPGQPQGFSRNNILDEIEAPINPRNLKVAHDFDYDLMWGHPELIHSDYRKLLDESNKEKHGIIGKPVFVSAETGNYALKPSSPGFNKGLKIPNITDTVQIGAYITGDEQFPIRPLAVRTDISEINFYPQKGKKSLVVTLSSKGKFSGKFNIRKNKSSDWFSVNPQNGILKPGDEVKLNVAMDNASLDYGKVFKGIFLIRFENGFSRPITVYGHVTGKKLIKQKTKKFAAYIEGEKYKKGKVAVLKDTMASDDKCIKLEEKDNFASYQFNIPADGRYYFYARAKSDYPLGSHDSFFYTIDKGEKARCDLGSLYDWNWSRMRWKKLKKGDHTLNIYYRETVDVDLFLVTDDPGMMY